MFAITQHPLALDVNYALSVLSHLISCLTLQLALGFTLVL